ncbi:GTP diphosphokinase [Marinicellulosiphila megalodicopiae]|uniref:GTP diphosphokinase n=1 Tax=Marinicellulosiphila megalodicopiae TaxID=2724896 RepID=UPI003BAE29D4
MVKVREEHPVFKDGTVDIDQWMIRLQERMPIVDEESLLRACKIARVAHEEGLERQENAWQNGTSSYHTGLEMAMILSDLHLDEESLIAAILYRCVRENTLAISTVKDQFGSKVASLIKGVLQMAMIHTKFRSTRAKLLGQDDTQGEAIRKMLVTIVDDVRVALIKLAERTCAIRAVKTATASKRYRVAREVFDIYAPLAHRLGVGHLKWELEDLSFRYIEPQEYKRIANLISETRLDRQEYIDRVLSDLKDACTKQNIEAQIYGRAKHIYSIWRKMTKKNINFSQVYDIRAVRIMVENVTQCYQVLGIVHSYWRHIPKEFDDYIASPKPNGYSSLHTAVIGPEGKTLEIQIRTPDMHQDAELGVCAHWKYKGTDTKGSQASRSYEEKINWLRSVLEWHEEIGDLDGFSNQMAEDSSAERIYVLTPEGHIVDLHKGATPLDFAYKVHTEIGHSCRGAKVAGQIVPLSYELQIGDRIEILTTKNGTPSRDWLNKELGFVTSSRARSKIKHWFKSQNRDQNIIDGRITLQREIQRYHFDNIDYNLIALEVNFDKDEDMFAAIGAGDLSVMHVIHAAEDIYKEKQESFPIFKDVVTKPLSTSDINIQGVGNLLTNIANCCLPVPGDAIGGFITQGRGVTIHRADCVNFLQLENQEAQRIISVNWGHEPTSVYPVEIHISAYDRTNLLMDIMKVLSVLGVNITKVNTISNKNESLAEMRLTIEIENIHSLSKIFAHISKISNIINVERAVV